MNGGTSNQGTNEHHLFAKLRFKMKIFMIHVLNEKTFSGSFCEASSLCPVGLYRSNVADFSANGCNLFSLGKYLLKSERPVMNRRD